MGFIKVSQLVFSYFPHFLKQKIVEPRLIWQEIKNNIEEQEIPKAKSQRRFET
jgi:p-aminobenzoyl-glutamate transporter AbgT